MRILEIGSLCGATLLLSGMVFPVLRYQRIEDDRAIASGDLRNISQAVRRFHADTGKGPTRGARGDRTLFRLVGPGRRASDSYYQDDSRQGELGQHLVRNEPTGRPEESYEGWHGPYWKDSRADPWGHAYVLVAYPMFLDDARSVIVVCAGANGEFDADYSSPYQPIAAGDDLLEVVFPKSEDARAPLY